MLLNGEELWASFQSFFPSPIIDDFTWSLKNNFLGFFRGRLILSVFLGFSAFFCLFNSPSALSPISGDFSGSF